MKYLFTFFLICSSILFMNVLNAQWESSVRLTNYPAKSSTTDPNAKSIASSGDLVHIVWYDSRNGNWEIYYKRSTDGGQTWKADTRITENFFTSDYPSIAVENLNVHIVWEDENDGNFEIYYKHSTDGGTSWEPEVRLTNDIAESYQPSIAVSGSDVHVVWYENRDGVWEIYYKHSSDNGISWSDDTRLTSNPAESYFPSVAASGSLVHVMWSEYRDEDEEIYYKRSTDGGLTWGQDIRLTNSKGYSEYSSVSSSGLYVHTAWYDFRDVISQIFYKRSTDAGVNWEEDKQISDGTYNASYANLSSSGSNVHIVWGNDDSREVYYRHSSDYGVTWDEEMPLTYEHSASIPSVSASGTSVHTVWVDRRDGMNNLLYYRRNPSGNILGVDDETGVVPVSIYPNPASDLLEIKLSESSELSESHKINIYNMLGECVSNLTPTLSKGEGVIRIDISHLPVGMYSLVINSGGNIDIKKFVILR
ncbi:MAG: exo-alpha-sialidase [bacterium]